MSGYDQFATPEWLRDLVSFDKPYSDPKEIMRAAVRVAVENVRQGGGPFSAVIADASGRVVEAGWNNVVQSSDSTAHAEIHCIRRAQRKLGSHDLSSVSLAQPLSFYVSCAPCIQCFGAIYWSGLRRVIAGARKEHAESLGFLEGPVSGALWDAALRDKGIEYSADLLPDAEVRGPFEAYAKSGGEIY